MISFEKNLKPFFVTYGLFHDAETVATYKDKLQGIPEGMLPEVVDFIIKDNPDSPPKNIFTAFAHTYQQVIYKRHAAREQQKLLPTPDGHRPTRTQAEFINGRVTTCDRCNSGWVKGHDEIFAGVRYTTMQRCECIAKMEEHYKKTKAGR